MTNRTLAYIVKDQNPLVTLAAETVQAVPANPCVNGAQARFW